MLQEESWGKCWERSPISNCRNKAREGLPLNSAGCMDYFMAFPGRWNMPIGQGNEV